MKYMSWNSMHCEVLGREGNATAYQVRKPQEFSGTESGSLQTAQAVFPEAAAAGSTAQAVLPRSHLPAPCSPQSAFAPRNSMLGTSEC